MNIYIYGSSEMKLDQHSNHNIHFVSPEELISQIKVSTENDTFIWQYDYPWSNLQNTKNNDTSIFDNWNKEQQNILSIIKKTKRHIILFNKSVITLESVLKHVTNPTENIKNNSNANCKNNLNIYLGILFLWGKKYWRTLEFLDGISLRPMGLKPIKKSTFALASNEILLSAISVLSNLESNENKVTSLKENINLRFNEIATLTLMLKDSQNLQQSESLKNSQLSKIVELHEVELKRDTIKVIEHNQELKKEISDGRNILDNLEAEINLKNSVITNSENRIKELSMQLSKSKKSLNCRFNELAVITDMLEKANTEISNLQAKLIIANEKHEKIKNSFSWKATAPIRALSHPVKTKKEKSNKKLNETIKLIRESKYFDAEWYLSKNPDVKKSGIDPARHYLLFGGFENRDPSIKFSNELYLKLHPDVKEKGINPLEHYITFGVKENRRISY
ncbi:hypothetical protein NB069_02765 [Leclercia adecarboxylata]|uniref:hypothetical protein n=1 Tax=Leclercia adecarboxylata TaxID=83655 RepID=UPI00202A4FE8|nr:hypothetical protein [Leclercia adecarboxylata]URN99825.1 hypothetical protein NB069_02765 [Leclercia adecarboxylata]